MLEPMTIKTEHLGDAKTEKKEMIKNNRKLRAAIETPEQAAARREKRKEYLQRKKIQRCPEELAKAAEKAKERRALRDARETPEENAIRRAKAAERERKRRILAKLRLQCGEKSLEDEEKLKKEMELRKQRAQFRAEKLLNADEKLKKEMELKKRREHFRALKEKETPEQAAARRMKANASERRRRQQMLARAAEFPEKVAARRAKKAEYESKRRKKLLLQDHLNGVIREKKERKRQAPKGATKIRPKNAEMQKMGIRTRSFLQSAKIGLQSTVVNPDGLDEDLNESCTWSSCGPSEGSFSVTTTEASYSITTTDERSSNQNVSEAEETIIVKNEPFDNSYAEGSNLSFLIQEVFEDVKVFASIKDESIDVEYKPSTSHQGLEEKNIKTDKDVGFESECKNKIETTVFMEPVLQGIIVKEEVDL